MTCIVGIVESGTVYLGGDSAAIDTNYGRVIRRDRKVFRLDRTLGPHFAIGFTGSFRMGQLLQYRFQPPALPPDRDLQEYMVTSFVDAVRSAYAMGGFAKVDEEGETTGEFLVGVRGRLFKIESNYQVSESVDNYAACGCGEDIALGSLFTTKGMLPSTRLLYALAAASAHSAGVARPFRYADTESL